MLGGNCRDAQQDGGVPAQRQPDALVAGEFAGAHAHSRPHVRDAMSAARLGRQPQLRKARRRRRRVLAEIEERRKCVAALAHSATQGCAGCPLGIAGEVREIWVSLPGAGEHALPGGLSYFHFLVSLLVLYLPGSPIMISHMLAQRKKELAKMAEPKSASKMV